MIHVQNLSKYYGDRKAWLLEEDGEAFLSPYIPGRVKGTITSNLDGATARRF